MEPRPVKERVVPYEDAVLNVDTFVSDRRTLVLHHRFARDGRKSFSWQTCTERLPVLVSSVPYEDAVLNVDTFVSDRRREGW